MTPEERKAFGEKMKLARQNKNPKIDSPKLEVETLPASGLEEMQRQINEVMETNALLKAALLRGNDNSSVNIGRQGVLGVIDKYLVDPNNYADPTKRLSQENRLQSIAFNHNYELEYEFSLRPYESKGINYQEPEFIVTLLKVVLDDQGNRVQIVGNDGVSRDKFFKARRMVFHEDPQAALVIARDNNIDIDKSDEVTFLNEMRYIRVRDWLFGYFWPIAAKSKDGIREEVVGGTIVEVYTKSSVEPSSVDFDQLKSKV